MKINIISKIFIIITSPLWLVFLIIFSVWKTGINYIKVDVISKIIVVITFPLWLIFLIVTFAWKVGESLSEYFILQKEYDKFLKINKN